MRLDTPSSQPLFDMHQATEKLVREHAYFVAGSEAWFRHKDDPVVEHAIRQATAYLDSLPKTAIEPQISGATVGDEDRIIDLLWLVRTSSGLRTVEVSFFRDGQCSAKWASRNGHETLKKNLTLAQLIDLDISKHVMSLRRLSRPLKNTPSPR